MLKVLFLNPPNEFREPVGRDLIYGCWCHGKRVADMQLPPLHLLYLATNLRELGGHQVRVLDALALDLSPETIAQEAKPFDAVVVHTSNTTFRYDLRVLAAIKQARPDLKAILTGPHPTVYPELVMQNDLVDLAVRGEAEDTLVDWAGKASRDGALADVAGLVWRQGREVRQNPPRPLRQSLDEWPFPDRTLVDSSRYYNPHSQRSPFTTALTSRGCVARCIFCTSPPFYNGKIRQRSPENVLAELKLLRDQGFREVLFRDEAFTENRKRLRAICQGMIDRGLDLTWIGNSRVGVLDEEDMRLMKRAGCFYLWVGVESGSQKVLDQLNKGITVEQTREMFRLANRVGINLHAHLMFGNPGETEDDIRQSISFLKEIEPAAVDIGITTPFPGTELFDRVKAADPAIGDGSDLQIDRVHNFAYFSKHYCELDQEFLENALVQAYRDFYLRPAYVLRYLRRIRSFQQFLNVVRAFFNLLAYLFHDRRAAEKNFQPGN